MLKTIEKIRAENISRIREQQGITQSIAAERAEIPFRSWQRAEDPRANITLSTLGAIARGLKVPIGSLLEEPSDKPQQVSSPSLWRDLLAAILDLNESEMRAILDHLPSIRAGVRRAREIRKELDQVSKDNKTG